MLNQRTPPELANITLRFSTLTSLANPTMSSSAGNGYSSASRGIGVPGPGILSKACPKVAASSTNLPIEPL